MGDAAGFFTRIADRATHDVMEDLDLVALAPPIVQRRTTGLAYGDPGAWALLFEPSPGRAGFAQIVVQDRREQRFFGRVRALLGRMGVTPARYRVRPPAEAAD